MRFKRLVFLTILLSLAGAATVFADDAVNWYKGKKVKVIINNYKNVAQGIIIDSKTMVSISDLAEQFQALIKWDGTTQTVSVYKPNVHIFLFEVGDKNKITRPFGNVTKGGSYDFAIFSQVDSLLTNVYSIKVTLEDPYGKVVESEVKQMGKDQKDNFWFITPTISHQFNYSGKYKVNFYMKWTDDSDYTLVSEKVVQSLND